MFTFDEHKLLKHNLLYKMEPISFNEYLKTELENSTIIFDYYLNYLDGFSANSFPYKEQLKMNGAAGKFIDTVNKVIYLNEEKQGEYINSIEYFIDKLVFYRNSFDFSLFHKLFRPINKKLLQSKIKDLFQDIYTSTVNYINEATKRNSYYNELELNGFYQPKNSNKVKVKKLINEAIELIKEDDTLNEKSKKQIINHLNRAVNDIDYEHVNWSRLIGRIKETIIVLGAIGSLIGGTSPLFQAKEKLEESTTVIQKTSINISYSVLNETFNNQSVLQIENINTGVLQIGESIDDIEDITEETIK